MILRPSAGLFAVAILAASPSVAQPALSDLEAKRLIQEKLPPEQTGTRMLLGRFNVISGTGDSGNGIMTDDGYRATMALRQMGLIEVKEVSTVPKIIEIKASEAAMQRKEINGLKHGVDYTYFDGSRYLVWRGNLQVDTIVRNEPIRKGIDQYRIVMYTYTFSFTHAFEQLYQLINQKWNPKRKAIVALKYDDFNKVWVSMARDVADADQEFQTDYVAQVFK
jgi:hypothetical protein